MSYDVSLVIDAGGQEPAILYGLDENYTYNCSDMLAAAIGYTLGELDGWPATEVAEALTRAIEHMTLNPDKYTAMNPDNGWGDSVGWLKFITRIRDACLEAPKAKLMVS